MKLLFVALTVFCLPAALACDFAPSPTPDSRMIEIQRELTDLGDVVEQLEGNSTRATEATTAPTPKTMMIERRQAKLRVPAVGFKEYSDCIMGTHLSIREAVTDQHGGEITLWSNLDYAEDQYHTNLPTAVRDARLFFILTACAPAKPEVSFGVFNCVGRAIDYFLQRHVWYIHGKGWNHPGHEITPLTGLFGLTVCQPSLVPDGPFDFDQSDSNP